jgi:hypothetical protein
MCRKLPSKLCFSAIGRWIGEILEISESLVSRFSFSADRRGADQAVGAGMKGSGLAMATL